MSYVTSFYHIVISTYARAAVITHQYRTELYSVLASAVNKRSCKAIIINGVEDHIHMLISLSPNVALAELMRDVKSQSSYWAKRSGHFPMFDGWADGYGAFSVSANHRQSVYEYIQGQQEHHKDKKLDEEFKRLVLKNGLVYYDW